VSEQIIEVEKKIKDLNPSDFENKTLFDSELAELKKEIAIVKREFESFEKSRVSDISFKSKTEKTTLETVTEKKLIE
jgi:hypothetical protein